MRGAGTSNPLAGSTATAATDTTLSDSKVEYDFGMPTTGVAGHEISHNSM